MGLGVRLVEALIAQLRRDGVHLLARGRRLYYKPSAKVSPENRRLLLLQKAEIISFLGGSSAGRNLWPEYLEDLGPLQVGDFAECSRCGRGSWVRYGATILCLACTQRSTDAEVSAPVSADPLASAGTQSFAGRPARGNGNRPTRHIGNSS